MQSPGEESAIFMDGKWLCSDGGHTQTHSRAAGSGSKCTHAPTVAPTVPHLTPTHHPQTVGQLAAVFNLS